MARYRKKPVEVEAVQWLKVGDHPAVKAVRKWDRAYCPICEKPADEHGNKLAAKSVVANLGVLVCPGDFIVTDTEGRSSVVKPDIFEARHDKVGE